MSAVRHMDMGFHNDDSAACNKNMGYGSDNGAIRNKRRDSRSVMREWRKTVSNKVVAAVWFT